MNKYKKKAKKHISSFKTIFSLLIFLTVVINVLVDPYNIFLFTDSHKRGYHVGHMPGAGGHSHILKAAGIIKFKPDTILLGSSVADTGFRIKGNFAHRQITKEVTPIETLAIKNNFGLIYNASVRGGGIPTMLTYLKHAYLNNSNLKHVFIGFELPLLNHMADGAFNDHHISENKIIGKNYIPLSTIFKYTLTSDVTAITLKTSKLKIDLPEISLNKTYELFSRIFSRNISTHDEQNEILSETVKSALNNPEVLLYQDSMPIQFIDKLITRELFLSNIYTKSFVKGYRNNKKKLNRILLELDEMIQFLKDKNIPYTVYICPMSPYNHALLYHTNNYDIIYDLYDKLTNITPFYNFSKATIFGNEYYNGFYSGDAVHFSSHVGEILSKYLLNEINKKNYYVSKKNYKKVAEELERDSKKFINNKDNYSYYSVLNKNILNNSFKNDKKFDLNFFKNEKKFDLLVQRYDQHFKKLSKDYSILGLYGKFYALPKQKEKYDLAKILKNSDNNILDSKSLLELIKMLNELNGGE